MIPFGQVNTQLRACPVGRCGPGAGASAAGFGELGGCVQRCAGWRIVLTWRPTRRADWRLWRRRRPPAWRPRLGVRYDWRALMRPQTRTGGQENTDDFDMFKAVVTVMRYPGWHVHWRRPQSSLYPTLPMSPAAISGFHVPLSHAHRRNAWCWHSDAAVARRLVKRSDREVSAWRCSGVIESPQASRVAIASSSRFLGVDDHTATGSAPAARRVRATFSWP